MAGDGKRWSGCWVCSPRAAAGTPHPAGGAPAEAPGSVCDDSRGRYAHDGFKTYWEALERVATAQQADDRRGERGRAVGVDPPIRREVGGRGLRGLSLGCAEAAAPELAFARSGLFEAVDVMDLAAGRSAGSVGWPASSAWSGFATSARLEQVRLDPDSYDVIWSSAPSTMSSVWKDCSARSTGP